MPNPLIAILKTGVVTQRGLFPDLPAEATGLPKVTPAPCTGCGDCADACPTQAISLASDEAGTVVALDRGLCVGCGICVERCSSGTIIEDRSTRTAALSREELVLTNRPKPAPAAKAPGPAVFRRSLAIREVSTGDNAADLEVVASTNAVYDIAQHGVSFVASPRFADALLVTGPVARAMREPLLRCYEAMADPRLVIAMGTSAISGSLYRGGYAEANGVTGILPVTSFVPGDPPHPWSLIHGILLAMGHNRA
ncbi:MAG TPA: 4Fe-4S binding protein [Armatimonadota bacterium]|jgi:Ni,Fe-hydrogenase III small subunit/NAD-dependent dihydropyrimidine dehydrogenase PreA subunit